MTLLQWTIVSGLIVFSFACLIIAFIIAKERLIIELDNLRSRVAELEDELKNYKYQIPKVSRRKVKAI